jgi:predicted phage terminase large subunit-like protein
MSAGPMLSQHRLLDSALRNNFVAFTHQVFRELHPGRKMIPSWHHEAIAYCLEVTAMTHEVDRAIINLPPRSLKSIMVSVALPAFLLGRDPTRKIIVVSYNQELADDLSRKTRQVMRSAWYQKLFPSTAIVGQGAVGQYFTTQGGFRAALSTGGTFTGKGGDLIIIDDPLKAGDAHSQNAREALLEWATVTLFSRLDDKLNGAIILVQQRQHEDDLSGHMLRAGGWYHLNLPSTAEADERVTLCRDPFRYHDRRIGDVLDPVREPQHVLDKLKAQMGSADFLAQYQQAPVPPDGDVIKIAWFREYDELPPGGYHVFSVDTAVKGGLRNDWSVLMCWYIAERRYYLRYVWRRRVEFPELLRSVKAIANEWMPEKIVIEDKGSGSGLIQTLRDDPEGFPVIAYEPGPMDKESRMRVQAHKIEGGQVFLPREAPWKEDFLEEIRRFPGGAHDDQIDALSQFLDHVGQNHTGKLIVFR